MAIRFDQIELYSSNNHYYPVIHGTDSQRLRVQGSGGRVDIGDGSSTSWGYILTDRANFYVDKGVHFDGNIQGYGGDETASFATYYDRNNTSYFVNPASNSTLLEASIGTTAGVGTFGSTYRPDGHLNLEFHPTVSGIVSITAYNEVLYRDADPNCTLDCIGQLIYGHVYESVAQNRYLGINNSCLLYTSDAADE